MKKNELEKHLVHHSGDAEVLCKEIRDQSEQEATGILDQARKDVGAVLAQAKAEAETEATVIIKRAENQVEFVQKRILSGVHLEVKRQELRAREAIVIRVLDTAKNKWNNFRKSNDYIPVLTQLIVEGVTALEGNDFTIRVGGREKEIFTKTVISGVIQKIEKQIGRDVSLSVEKDVSDEGGAMIVSADERMHFDNRFSARMERLESRIRLEIASRLFV